MPSRLTKACTGARDVRLTMTASIARAPGDADVRHRRSHVSPLHLHLG